MKTSPAFVPTVLALIALTAVVFALFEYSNHVDLSAQLDSRVASLREARELAARHPDIFGPSGTNARVDLKSLVQAMGSKHGVDLVYLNETNREAGEKAREINVVARAVNVAHSKLVLFLADVEAGAGGARFKDLRLRPKAGRGDEYEEAEAILSLRVEKKSASGADRL